MTLENLTTMGLAYWPYLLALVSLVFAIAIGYAIRLGKRVIIHSPALQKAQTDSSSEPQPPSSEEQSIHSIESSPTALKKSFEQALKILKSSVGGRRYRYEIPWFLIVGESQSGNTAILPHLGLPEITNPSSEYRWKGEGGLIWKFFDQAVAIEVPGEFILRTDGQSSDNKGWEAILRLLQTYRPERPLDGIILTIPVPSLRSGGNLTGHQVLPAQERGERLYRKLQRAQRILGMDVPIYVLVSQCDRVPGFQSFCQELPEQFHDNIVGWSNPYSLDTVYSTEWVGEAFRTVEEGLFDLQLRIFAGRTQEISDDGFFLFPTELQTLKGPLSQYLDQIFKQSTYHQSFYLRGIYFCGAKECTEPTAEHQDALPLLHLPAEPHHDQQIVFIKHLFAERIFPERAVATPDTHAMFSRNRVALLAQGLAVVGTVAWGSGLWYAADRFSSYKPQLVPVLTEIRDDLMAMTLHTGEEWNPRPLDHSTADLLRGITQAGTVNLRSAFIPSSWFIPLQNQLLEAITIGYRYMVIQNIGPALQQRINRVLSGSTLPPTENLAFPLGASLEQMPEYIRLNQYVADLLELEKNLDRYHALQHREEGQLGYLDSLLNYLFDLTLQKEIQEHADVFRRALAEATFPPVSILPAHEEHAQAMVWDLGQQFFHQAFEENRVFLALQDLATQFDGIDQASRTSEGPSALHALWTSLEDTHNLLQSAEARWLAREHLDLGPAYSNTLEQITQSAFLHQQVSHDLQRAGANGFDRLKARVTRLETPVIGTILHDTDTEFGLEFSSPVIKVKKELAAVFDVEFMKHEPSTTQVAHAIPPRTRLIWDQAHLDQALRHYQDYTTFRESHARSVPPTLDRIITRVLRRRVEAVMRETLAKAQRFEPWEEGSHALRSEDDIRLEMQSLNASKKQLGDLLDIFERENFDDSFWDLMELMAMQAGTLLAHIDGLLETQQPYVVRGGTLRWWQGRHPLALAAYEVTSTQGLKSWVAAQRERIKYLAREYAEPLLPVMMKTSIYQDLSSEQKVVISKWQGIVETLDAYDKKKPGNSLLELEQFIVGPLAQADLSHCFTGQWLSPPPSQHEDFFRTVHLRLIRQTDERCQALTSAKVSEGYGKIEQFFNRQLAGRFPFGEPQEAQENADYQTIQDFFNLYDDHLSEGVGPIERNRQFGLSRQYVVEFLQRMNAVRKFFAPILQANDQPSMPVFDFDVEFRTNRAHEIQGNHIVDWELRVGRQQFRIHEGPSKGRWVWGDPVSMTFRWAKNAPTRPSRQQEGPHIRVDDDTVTFYFSDSWALLRLLVQHAGSPADFDRLQDPEPQTIKFVIPIVPVGDETAHPELNSVLPTEAQVFVRIRLRSPNNKTAIKVPVFPRFAPPLNRVVAHYGNGA